MDAGTHIAFRLAAALALGLVAHSGCTEDRPDSPDQRTRPATCPGTRRVEPPLAHVAPPADTLEYWLVRNAAYGPLDEPLMDADAVRRHQHALREPRDGEPIGQVDLLAPIDRDALQVQLDERLGYMRQKLEADELFDSQAEALGPDLLASFVPPAPIVAMDEWRVVEKREPLRCGPYDGGLHTSPVDPDFDRNRCSTMREGELVQLLARWPNGMYLARTPYTLGWVRTKALSPAITRGEVESRRQSRELRPFTRRELLSAAFSMRGEPYGWGGKGGGYDCSRFLLEVFARFGIDLPRHSARQAMAGTFSIDVSRVEDANEKRLLIEASARRGIVLLHFPGHIMLYLGTSEEGVPMVIHSFSEYLTPCVGLDLETVNRVDRVAVSDLSLGAGSSRGDFLSRITRITVLGKTPGPALIADAELRPSAPVSLPEQRCAGGRQTAIFRSPQRPDSSRPLRVIVTGERDPGLASLVLFAPDGSRLTPAEHVLDGPPSSRWVEVPEPEAGRWTAVFADGDLVRACESFVVAKRPAPPAPRSSPGPAWTPRRKWERDTENLYAAFVEQLFVEPRGEDVTWPRLQELIGERDRNLLYDYRAVGEDARLDLEPDCADLPYFLRAYFAWKLQLPFVYRACTRGRKDTPPVCEPTVFSNLDAVPDSTDAGAFRRFTRRIAGTVHSSSPRTLPSDDQTDLYPVRLSRRAIRPGTVFADPYGHVLVVARWKPQGVSDYGVLIGADAQPDGTVGRRRFWRGSFLFTPTTDLVGAGFKAWRPVRYAPNRVTDTDTDADTDADADAGTDVDATPQPWDIMSNDRLRNAGGIRGWSDAQYKGSADDFYAAMEGMINPRALDPVRMQASLVDALEESVQRRLSSVQNGEDFMKSHGKAAINMPRGAALFLTTGPWEDYSTPSRDMRLLISMDAVVTFPDKVAAHPERFGIPTADRDTAVEQVRAALQTELEKRSFEYVRSDGTAWQLTLAALVARSKAMEVAYNPNDCMEIRWGAPEGSEERSTCNRRAPQDQRSRMQSYRKWFAKRERPG
ncbi:MAG: C40 family peptidase [Deltaproteobacteria bacterium]|nr:C40 family peptidase [Deltaproteobacteria bacterium]